MHGDRKDLIYASTVLPPIDPRSPPITTDPQALSTNPAWVTRRYSRNNQHKVLLQGLRKGQKRNERHKTDMYNEKRKQPICFKNIAGSTFITKVATHLIILKGTMQASKSIKIQLASSFHWFVWQPFYHSLHGPQIMTSRCTFRCWPCLYCK